MKLLEQCDTMIYSQDIGSASYGKLLAISRLAIPLP